MIGTQEFLISLHENVHDEELAPAKPRRNCPMCNGTGRVYNLEPGPTPTDKANDTRIRTTNLCPCTLRKIAREAHDQSIVTSSVQNAAILAHRNATPSRACPR